MNARGRQQRRDRTPYSATDDRAILASVRNRFSDAYVDFLVAPQHHVSHDKTRRTDLDVFAAAR